MFNRLLLSLTVLLALTVTQACAAGLTVMVPDQQFFDNQGYPLAGGSIYTCYPGTTCGPGSTTLKTTYSDASGAHPNYNPVILDAGGRANIWISGYYKTAIYDAAGNLIRVRDNVPDNVGPAGPTGPAGPVGPAGPTGPAGPLGSNWTSVVNTSYTTTTSTDTNISLLGGGLPRHYRAVVWVTSGENFTEGYDPTNPYFQIIHGVTGASDTLHIHTNGAGGVNVNYSVDVWHD